MSKNIAELIVFDLNAMSTDQRYEVAEWLDRVKNVVMSPPRYNCPQLYRATYEVVELVEGDPVRFGNYIPPEIDSIHYTEEQAQQRANELGGQYHAERWEVKGDPRE